MTVAGILGIISIFTPTLYIDSDNAFVWVWNLYVSSDIVDFVQTEEVLFDLGVAATLFIAIGILVTLFSGIVSKVKDKHLNLFAIIGGVLLLIGPIIYLGGITAEEENLWEYFTVNIGSILSILAGSIAILAGVMGIIKRKS